MSRGAVLVTGVSRGIGAAIAARLAADGYGVVGISRGPVAGFDGHHRALDLADPAAKDGLRAIAEEFRPLRLVANAGIVGAALVEDVTDDDFDRVMRTNLQSVIWATQAVLPHMRAARFGRIVTIGSRAALGKRRRAVYASSKAGVVGLTRSMALELGEHGITVNCVAPGPIDTELFAENQPERSPERERLLRAVPVGRIGTPADVAAAVAFLASDEAGFVTGQTLHVCGGMSVGGMGA